MDTQTARDAKENIVEIATSQCHTQRLMMITYVDTHVQLMVNGNRESTQGFIETMTSFRQ